jgi:predicted MFS family arabinose efflux permease
MAVEEGSVTGEWRRGWSVVAVATIGMATGAGLYLYLSSLFIGPLGSEFGWSRGDISSAGAIGLLGALSAPVIGRIADRFGARRVAVVCIIALAVCFVALSAMSGTYWHFLALSALLGVAAPGGTAQIYGRAVATWFDRSKGLALGITAGGVSVGAMVFAPLVQAMITQYGSTGGYLTFAALMLGIALPMTAIGLRERQTAQRVAASPASVTEALQSVPWHRLARGRTFWILAAAIFAGNAPAAGVLTQFEPLVRERGVPDPALLLSLFAFSVLAGRIGIGWLFDRLDARWVAAAVTVAGILGCLMLTSSVPAVFVPVAIILIGFLQGAETDVLAYFVARYFGLHAFSTIYGLLLAIAMLGTAVGIVGFGQLFDIHGSYDIPLVVASLLLVPAIGAYLTLPAGRTIQSAP